MVYDFVPFYFILALRIYMLILLSLLTDFDHIIYLFVYVDDLIIADNSISMVNKIVVVLS